MILRELRERKRISQQALGELFEVSAQTINNWECGKAEPDFEALMGLALFFGVSVDTLIGFDVKGNASTLRSCPFCGGRARIITGVSTSGSLKPSAHIKCEDCLAETAWAEDVNSDGTFIDEAKRRWNMRIHKIGEKHMAGIHGVIKLLGGGQEPTPLSNIEAAFINQLSAMLKQPSVLEFSEDGSYQCVSGFLADNKDKITKVERRYKRATVLVAVAGEDKPIKVSFTEAEQMPVQTED